MTKRATIWIGLLGLALASAAAAGDYKCTEEAAVCLRKMVHHIKQKGWIGIEAHVPEEGARPVIARVLAGGPAEEAGLQAGDVLVAFAGIRYSEENREALTEAKKKALVPGHAFTLTVDREGRQLEFRLVPIEVPPHILAQWVGEHMIEQHAGPAEPAAAAKP